MNEGIIEGVAEIGPQQQAPRPQLSVHISSDNLSDEEVIRLTVEVKRIARSELKDSLERCPTPEVIHHSFEGGLIELSIAGIPVAREQIQRIEASLRSTVEPRIANSQGRQVHPSERSVDSREPNLAPGICICLFSAVPGDTLSLDPIIPEPAHTGSTWTVAVFPGTGTPSAWWWTTTPSPSRQAPTSATLASCQASPGRRRSSRGTSVAVACRRCSRLHRAQRS